MKVSILNCMALTLVLSACDGASQDDAPDVPMAEVSPSGNASASADPASTESGPAPSITLAGNGLQAVQAVDGRGTATVFGFGDARETTLAAMTVLLGEPELSSNGECGAGPLDFADFGALTLNFQDGRFVGYSVDERSGRAELLGPDGLAIGAPKDVVAKIEGYQTYDESTLGDEFNVGSGEGNVIVGLFGNDGRVTDLWSGAVCNFR